MFYESATEEENTPLLHFSETEERATLIDFVETEKSDSPSTKLSKKVKPKKVKKGIQVKEGQIALHIAGYPGIQLIPASELVHCFPMAKLKVAAKKYLKRSGVKPKRKARKKAVNLSVTQQDVQQTEKLQAIVESGLCTQATSL